MLTDFSFYRNFYGGTLIPENEFVRYCEFASRFISNMITSRFEISSDIKMAVCHVAEIFYRDNVRMGISSENNDGYSVSYDKSVSAEKLATEIASVYLGSSGLLYCGIG